MKKNDYCRFYKGEKTPPFSIRDPRLTAWKIEALWVHASEEMLSDAFSDYMAHGMIHFAKDDAVPISLKAFLMNRYFQYTEREDIEAFKSFYSQLYK